MDFLKEYFTVMWESGAFMVMFLGYFGYLCGRFDQYMRDRYHG